MMIKAKPKNIKKLYSSPVNSSKFIPTFSLLFVLLCLLFFGCSNTAVQEPVIKSQENDNSYNCSGYEEYLNEPSKVVELIPYIDILENVYCDTCHFAHHRPWPTLSALNHGDDYVSDPVACTECHGTDLSGGASQYSCNECHHGTGTMADGHSGIECTVCHDFSGPGMGGGDLNCGECHGISGTHGTHVVSNSKGPSTPLNCQDCHEGGNYPLLEDGNDLASSQICNNCHSPGGAYDGVNDPQIGAKNNWGVGVYNDGVSFKPFRERWCLGCHDSVPANSKADGSGISAPNIAGDDINYGFYVNGHGRSGANRDCLDCHDVANNHIDEDPRTYSFDSSYYGPTQSGVAYASNYRLRYVGGEVPLMIPGNYNITYGYDASLMRDTGFRLCFDSGCHSSGFANIFDDTPGDGISSNFKASAPNPPRDYSYAWGSGADTNEHVSHLLNYTGPFWDSDWDLTTDGLGGSNGSDSLVACSSCHNVHGVPGAEGSTNEAMIRDGSLAGRTGYGFSYVIEDTGSGGYPLVTSTGATQTNSVGAIFRNNTASMCGGSACHGDPVPPAGSSYDASGSSWDTYLEYYRPWASY